MEIRDKDQVQIGVDTGGTFTDLVCISKNRPIRIVKVPSTPDDPSQAIIEGLNKLKCKWELSADSISKFCHGTTVATNSLIQRKGGQVGVLATEGFEDVLEIGRQMRQQLYETILRPQTPIFLAPGRRRKGIKERIASNGIVLTEINEKTVLDAAKELVDDGVEAIAICFLFSFLNPVHELRARDIILSNFPSIHVSISSEVDPTFREYERTIVTAFDAYLKPVVDKYLINLDQKLKRLGLCSEPKLMQSRGALSAISIARKKPVRLFLSGPAAGVVGAANIGKSLNKNNLISVDIGGTSCDIALIQDGRPKLRAEGEIGGHPVRVNMVDVNAIGSGGGSLVWLDSEGGIRVGPESAGAIPGPACYDLGGAGATVTDASLILGFINPAYFAGGSVTLNYEKAHKVISDTIASKLNFSVERAAQGIHQVINSQMAEGVRLISTQRGLDPRNFTLIAIGGAGPIHAVAIAEDIGIRDIIVPFKPGVLSAIGLLSAPIEHETTLSVQRDLTDLTCTKIRSMLKPLNKKCRALMKEEGVEDMKIAHVADLCYVGQSYHLSIELFINEQDMLEQLISDFKVEHDSVYGHASDSPVKLINLKTVCRSIETDFPDQSVGGDVSCQSVKSERLVFFLDRSEPHLAQVYERKFLASGDYIEGPAIIEQEDTTTVIPDNWGASVSKSGDLVLSNR